MIGPITAQKPINLTFNQLILCDLYLNSIGQINFAVSRFTFPMPINQLKQPSKSPILPKTKNPGASAGIFVIINLTNPIYEIYGYCQSLTIIFLTVV